MKIFLSLKHVAALCLLVVSTASSASVWAPEGNVASFFATNLLGKPVLTATFGIFDDNVTIGDVNVNPVVQFTGFDAVAFTANGSNYGISTLFSGFSGNLSGSSNFQIGYLSSNGWVSEVFNSDEIAPFITFGFNNGAQFNNPRLLKVAGIVAVPGNDPVGAVPLPASIWMMTSALLGMLYAGRRKAVISA